jgi:hypothetical protein
MVRSLRRCGNHVGVRGIRRFPPVCNGDPRQNSEGGLANLCANLELVQSAVDSAIPTIKIMKGPSLYKTRSHKERFRFILRTLASKLRATLHHGSAPKGRARQLKSI